MVGLVTAASKGADVDDIAVRKLSRLGNELHMTASVAIAALVPGQFETAVVLVLLLRRCVDDWVDGATFRRPDAPARSSSINALAASLHKPYATVHRHVTRLIDDGWVVPVDKGIAVANHPGTERAIVDLLATAHDSLVRLAEDLDRDTPFATPRRPPVPDLRRLTTRRRSAPG